MPEILANDTSVPVGVVKQFGPYGPEYVVLGEAPLEGARRMVRVVLVRSGEEVAYPLDEVLTDPES